MRPKAACRHVMSSQDERERDAAGCGQRRHASAVVPLLALRCAAAFNCCNAKPPP